MSSDEAAISEAATASRQSRRLVFVDLLRGFACLWVIYCHFHGVWLDNVRHYGWDLDTLLVRIAGFGGKGVDLFVVLSGFCLFYPVLERAEQGRSMSAAAFYKRRALRILPVYFAVLIVSTVLVSIPSLRQHIAQYRGFGDLVPHLFLVQNYFPDYIGRINGPLWSIALECQLYLLMPIWVAMFRRGGPTWPLLTAAAVSVTAGALGAADVHFGPVTPFAGHGLPARLIEFVAGMAAAWFVRRPSRRHVPIALAALALTVPLAVASQTQFAQSILQPIGTVLWGTCFASLVVLASRLEARNLFRHRAFAPLAFVGLISYSVYAIHFPAMLLLRPWVNPLLTGIQAGFLWGTLIGLPILLLCGGLLYVLVERYSVPAVRRQPVAPPEPAADLPAPLVVAAASPS